MKSTLRTIAGALILAAATTARAGVGPSVEEPVTPPPQAPAQAAPAAVAPSASATPETKPTVTAPSPAADAASTQPALSTEAPAAPAEPAIASTPKQPTSSATKAAKARSIPDSQRRLGLPAPAERVASSKEPATNASWSIPSWVTQLGALVVVVGIILATGKLITRFGPSTGLMGALGPRGRAPSGVLEVLGRYPVSRGSMLVLLKLDRRILLVSQQSGRGGTTMQTLTEITDPAEVASLVARTADGSAPSARAFANTLERVGGAAIATPAAAAPAASSMPRQPVAAKTAPAPRRKANEPSLIELDGAAAAQALRTRLAAMQAAPAPVTAATSTREFTA